MAMQVSGASFSVIGGHRRPSFIKAVTSENITATVGEEKIQLGGSDLKVSRIGIGAWSWGDNSYWNNFQWDG